MKKTIVCLLLIVCLISMPVFAETLKPGLNIVYDNVVLTMDDAPYIENDRAVASGQYLCAAMDVAYRYADGVLTVGDGALVFTNGSDRCLINGVDSPATVTCREVNGVLFVPVRLLAETLGFKVDFKQQMTEDGQLVYASIVLIDPAQKTQVLSFALPEDKSLSGQVMGVASSLMSTEVNTVSVSRDTYAEKCMMMCAAGEACIFYYADGVGENLAGYDGIMHNLQPYLADLAPDTFALINENEEIRQTVTDASGAIYAFPVLFEGEVEYFGVACGVHDVETAVNLLNAYNQVAKALTVN